jgi:hypothetical protein
MPEVTDAVNFWLNLLRMDTASATSLDRSLVFETVFEEQKSQTSHTPQDKKRLINFSDPRSHVTTRTFG